MYPEFEKTKIIDDMVYCNIGKAYQKSTFGFSYSNINAINISKQISINVNDIQHSRVCSLIQDIDDNIYLRFRKITEDFHEDMLCQFYFKSKDFSCASCKHFYQGQDLKESCCQMKSNLIILNDCEIYKVDFLDKDNFEHRKSNSKIDFLSLHFGSVIDTIMLGDPV
jgi:hypothetical protein